MQRTEPAGEPKRVAIVGPGRLGTAIAAALREDDQLVVTGPLGRGADAVASDVVLLCVPDREIAAAAAMIAPARIVGHCSGATNLLPLAPHERFSLHPLMTVPRALVPCDGASFRGATAAIDASSDRALAVAQSLARSLGMRTVRVAPDDRVAYHAAASMASNFLVTLEAAAERLAASAGVSREALAPLVLATVRNWAALGPGAALTGPVARGDELTVAAQRAAVAERAPELLELFDALTETTRTLATSTLATSTLATSTLATSTLATSAPERA